MAIIEMFNQPVGKWNITPTRKGMVRDPSGFGRGDVCHVWPDDNVDGWTDFAAYLVEYPKRMLVHCPGMPLDRARRCWKERWERVPVPGEWQYDDEGIDDEDRIILLGRKRWCFNIDPDNDEEPDHPGRSECRRILEGEHIVTAYETGRPRPAQFNPWMHDRCKDRDDTIPDVDKYDVATNRRKSPKRRMRSELRARRSTRSV